MIVIRPNLGQNQPLPPASPAALPVRPSLPLVVLCLVAAGVRGLGPAFHGKAAVRLCRPQPGLPARGISA